MLLDVKRKSANGKQWLQIPDVNSSCSGGRKIFHSIKCFNIPKQRILKLSLKMLFGLLNVSVRATLLKPALPARGQAVMCYTRPC